MCQWEGSRLTDLKEFAQNQEGGKPISDWHVQADFVMHEFATTHKDAMTALKSANTPEQAAAAFDTKFEQSASLGDRPQKADAIYKQFTTGNTGNTETVSNSSNTGDSSHSKTA
jgi:hypothetical protein